MFYITWCLHLIKKNSERLINDMRKNKWFDIVLQRLYKYSFQSAFPPCYWQLIQWHNHHSSNFLTLLKMWLKEFPHLFFDCSPTTSLGGWPGDLFLCVIHKQACRNCWGRYTYLTFTRRASQKCLSKTLKEFVLLSAFSNTGLTFVVIPIESTYGH